MGVDQRRDHILTKIDPTTWSSILQEAVRTEEVKVIPYDLTLDYDYWTYRR